MDPILVVLVLMLAVAVFAMLASKIGIPYPTMMVVGGLVICGVVQWRAKDLESFSVLDIKPELILTLFLPPLLYGAAWQMSWKEFWANRRPIFLLAVGLVLFTTSGIAALAMALIPGFTWASAFALGAIVSPPDAIAVTALTKKVRLPRRVMFLLEGESLVNDASALVALRFAVAAAAASSFSIAAAAWQFVLVSAGGVVLGLVIGWFVSEIHRRINDPLIETTITFLTPYSAFLLAENLHIGGAHFSGVLATVAAGLYVSWQSPDVMTPEERIQATFVWEFVLFLLNGFVFVIVGLGLPSVLKALPEDFGTGRLIFYGLVIVAGMMLLRMAWVVPGTYLPWIISKAQRRSQSRPPMSHTLLVGWTGMRGVVSLAAALALPLTFPNRGVIIFLAFFAILVTLVLQSLTLPMVVRMLLGKGRSAEDAESEEREARLTAARAGLAYIKDLTESTDAFGEAGTELRTSYEKKVARLESGPTMLPLFAIGLNTTARDLKREVLGAERRAIVEMRAQQRIGTELFQRLMADLDVEELKSAE